MRKKIVLAAYCVLLCITVTFSWLFDVVEHHVYNVIIDYKDNGLFIVNANLDATLRMQETEKGEQVEVTDSFEFDSRRLIPNAVIPFTIEITNTSDMNSSITVSVLFNVDDPSFLEYLYMDMVVGDDDATTQKHVYRKLSVASRVGGSESNEYLLNLYTTDNKLFLESGASVTIDCFLYFDRNADSTYQGKSLKITAFRLEQ